VILREVEPLTQERFVGQLRKAGSERPILVFVHGYNTSFEEAAWRAAQMVYDLREWEFDGRAALYSWASRGTLTGYRDDERNVEAAVPHLAAFLELLAAEAGDAPVHLVAHSMGNRALTGALTRIDGSQTSFEQVLLAAPDMDAEVFNKQVAPRVAQRCDRLTLYASSNDRALQISGYWHRNRPRAGDAAGGISTTDQLESIDASACDTTLLGHSYVADKPSVLIDVATILHGLAPSERGGWLEQLEGFVWRLIPDGLE
jgi:esterase/lipase superfamily enzyme